MLYWAYGSNLNVEAMRHRCPGARRVGPLSIEDGALVFRWVADVVVRRGSVVPGAVWEINRSNEAVLDRYEGVATGYYTKRYLELSLDGGEPRPCLYYVMAQRRGGICPPSEGYLDTITQGYRDWGLDLEQLDLALRESWERKRLTSSIQRHRAKRSGPIARLRNYSLALDSQSKVCQEGSH